jgi:cell fate (sporulation/competence/biofilm development) regulator YmcA (YheA/YmcA/DUF963 family)
MAKTKAGFVRVGTDIPEDLHRRIKKYNKHSVNPLNMSKVMLQAIENEVAKIKAAEKIIEGTPLVDENGAGIICADGKSYTVLDLMVLDEISMNLSQAYSEEDMNKLKTELQKLQDSGNENITRVLKHGMEEGIFKFTLNLNSTLENPFPDNNTMKEVMSMIKKVMFVVMYLSEYNKIHYTKFPN